MKNLVTRARALAVIPMLVAGSAMAVDTPGAADLTAMGAAVDFSSVITVLGTVFAALIGFVLFRNAGLSIFTFIKGHAK